MKANPAPEATQKKERFGERVTRLRKQMGLRQCDLAKRLCVDTTTANKWEKSHSYPRLPMLPSIATNLGVTLAELVEGLADGNDEKEAA